MNSQSLATTLRGLPPLRPLARAASAFAADLALPPLRPSATAAGFLRTTEFRQTASNGLPSGLEVFRYGHVVSVAQHAVDARLLTPEVGCHPVDLAAGLCSFRGEPFKADRVGGVLVSDVVHVQIKPHRLGFVKEHKTR